MTEKLKPCPFCGGKAKTSSYRTMDSGHWIRKYYARCAECSVEMPTCLAFEDERKAIEAWNRRAGNE